MKFIFHFFSSWVSNPTCLNLQEGGDEYSLLVNLKRLYELQLTRNVPIENLFDDVVMILQSFRNMDDEVHNVKPS